MEIDYDDILTPGEPLVVKIKKERYEIPPPTIARMFAWKKAAAAFDGETDMCEAMNKFIALIRAIAPELPAKIFEDCTPPHLRRIAGDIKAFVDDAVNKPPPNGDGQKKN